MKSYAGVINKYLKKKKSYLSICISLILGISLITTISIISNSNYLNSVQKIYEKNGRYDIRIQTVDEETLKKVDENSSINEYAIGQSDGVVNIQYGGGKNKLVDVYALEPKAYEEYFDFKIVDGRMPTSPDEVMIDSSVINAFNKYYRVGDTITVDLETNRTKDDYDWFNFYAIHKDIEIKTEEHPFTGDLMDEKLGKLNVENRTYKIVGVIDCGENNQLWNNRIFRVMTDEELSNPRDFELFTRLNGMVSYKGLAEELGLVYQPIGSVQAPLGVPTSDIKFSGYNTEILNLKINSLGITILVFAFVCISIINSYNITISTKTKLYGVMRALGASRKQIAWLILKETLAILVIAIPLGIILGFGALYAQMNTVGKMFNVKGDYQIVFDKSTIWLIVGLVVSLIIFLIMKGVVKQSIITPIEAIRNANGYSSKKKRKKKRYVDDEDENEKLLDILDYEKTTLKYKILSKLYGFEGTLANKNIYRNTSRNMNSIMTLMIAMIMIVSFFVLLMNSIVTSKSLVKSTEWNSSIINEIGYLDNSNIEEFKKVENVEDAYLDYVSIIPAVISRDMFGKGLENSIEMGKEMNNYDSKYVLNAKVRGADERILESYKNNLVEGEIDINKLNDNGIILVSKGVNSYYYANNGVVTMRQFESNPTLKYKVGDEIIIPTNRDVFTSEGIKNFVSNDSDSIKLTVVGIVDEDTFETNVDRYSSDAMESEFKMITSNETFSKLTGIEKTNKALVKVNDQGDRAETTREIEKYCGTDGRYMNFHDDYNNLLIERKEIAQNTFYQIVIATTILIMVFVNLVVTSTANIIERKAEFAALTAIGMQKKQRLKVIFAEGTYIALMCMFIASIFGSVGVMGSMSNRSDLIISMGASLIIVNAMIIVVALISVLLCIIPARKLEGESIVDILKEEY
ncbi:MAG: FtsX-like permease family protein [Clostridium sp.]